MITGFKGCMMTGHKLSFMSSMEKKKDSRVTTKKNPKKMGFDWDSIKEIKDSDCSTTEAQKILGVPRNTVTNWAKTGKVKAYKKKSRGGWRFCFYMEDLRGLRSII